GDLACFFFSSRRRHTRFSRDWSSDVCSSDLYRIAAVDQLRTYANILNVPMEVVFSPAELHKAFHKLADRDLLLMDTAGRNYRNRSEERRGGREGRSSWARKGVTERQRQPAET